MSMLEESEILNLGNIAHKEFVDIMYSHFRIKKHPGYNPLEILRILYSGAMSFNPDVIFLNDIQGDENPENVSYVTYHESTHILHPFSRDLYYEVGREKYMKIIDPDFLEIIADLGVMFFLRLKTGTDERIGDYCSQKKEDTLKTAYSLFCRGDIELFGELVNLNQKEAKKKIRKILR